MKFKLYKEKKEDGLTSWDDGSASLLDWTEMEASTSTSGPTSRIAGARIKIADPNYNQ